MTVYKDLPVIGGNPYWESAVANFAALPVTGQTIGEMRVTSDTMQSYIWDGSAWVLAWVPDAVVGPASATDGQIMLFDAASGKLAKAATGNNFVRVTGGVYGTQNSISLTADVSNVLPVANGGTNSSTALNNNRVMRSTGGAITEASAITAARALISDANGIPTHSAVTGTELGYVSGVTSAIQTQIASKEPTITATTAADYYRGDKSFQTLNASALQAVTDGSSAAAGKVGEIISSTVAANTTTGVGATGVYGNVTTISLTAGVWSVTGTAGFNENGASLTTGLQVGISASTSGAGISEFDTQLITPLMAGADPLLATPVVLVNISSTTSYYLNTRFWYTAGTPQHRGRIQARRIR